MTQWELEELLLEKVRKAISDGDRMLSKRAGKFRTWMRVNEAVSDVVTEALKSGLGQYFITRADELLNEWENRHGMDGEM